MSDEDEDIEETMTSSMTSAMDSRPELTKLLGEIEWLLKDGGIIASLTARGINASLALVAVHGLRAYLVQNNKAQAAEDFSTVAEEIYGRLAAAVIHKNDSEGGGGDGSA
jgi:hypothetical protein